MGEVNNKVNFIKINKGWNAEPNSPMPTIKIEGRTVILSFYLNAFIYDDYEEDDIGILEFYNCRQYRIGSPNEDGFYIYNQSRYKKVWNKVGRILFGSKLGLAR